MDVINTQAQSTQRALSLFGRCWAAQLLLQGPGCAQEPRGCPAGGTGSPETPGVAPDLDGLEQRSEVALAEAAAAASLLHAPPPAGRLHLALAPDALDDLDEHCGAVAQRLAEDLQQDALQHPDSEQPLARMAHAVQA